MDILRERDEKGNLERQLREEQKVRANIQKRLRREKRARKRLQDQLDLELNRRAQLEDALKSAGSGEQIDNINDKIAQIQQQQQQEQQQTQNHQLHQSQQQQQQQTHPKPSSTPNQLTPIHHSPHTPQPSNMMPPPTPERIPERIKQEIEEPSQQYITPRDLRDQPLPHPQENKGWSYSGLDLMNTGAAFWQNYSDSLAQELDMERKARQQHMEREVKSPLQDRTGYYKNAVLFTSSAT